MSRALAEITDILKRLAPLEWAEPWDNVGLLIEPPEHPVAKVFLTIDLTEEVLLEAKTARVDLIVAYRPPIFSGDARSSKALHQRIRLASSHRFFVRDRSGLEVSPARCRLGKLRHWLTRPPRGALIVPTIEKKRHP